MTPDMKCTASGRCDGPSGIRHLQGWGTTTLPDFCHPLILEPGTDNERTVMGATQMPDDNYEPNRVFGMPRGTDPHARQGEEQQHALGMPAGWIGPVDPRLKFLLAHPVRAFRQWRLRRRL